MEHRFDHLFARFQTLRDGNCGASGGPPGYLSIEHGEGVEFEIIALAQWESDGGAVVDRREADVSDRHHDVVPTETEFQQLHVRVIALESVLISLIADAPVQQRAVVRGMAEFISPRRGYTAHPVTLRAAAEILSLADRAERISVARPSVTSSK